MKSSGHCTRAGVLAASALALVHAPAALALEAGGTPAVNGAALSPLWVLPFAGILLSIALMPLTAPGFWHHHFGKTTAFWTLAFVVPFTLQFGAQATFRAVLHTLLAEYLPFIILLTALFVVSGGILVRGNLHGSPARNTGLLALGTLLASVMGTTGAAMLLVRPLLRANDQRRHQAHVMVFFIFLVANVGGALTPLGDPPLFLGFLKGVDFFWTTKAMLLPTAFTAALLLGLFWLVDRHLWRREAAIPPRRDPTPDSRLGLDGRVNILLLAAVIATVLLSGLWKPERYVDVLGTRIALQDAARDVLLVAITVASLRLTSRRVHRDNHFHFGPIVEVAMLFAGIFLTIIPALAMLRAGHEGVFAPLLGVLSRGDGTPADPLYFWLTGALSSMLDNAPTYLVFFNLAGGDPDLLMGPLASTLTAISCGAVFMGALTYIGNAPNFMVKSIAEARGVRMPTFLGYMAWSAAVLLPVFAVVTLVFFA